MHHEEKFEDEFPKIKGKSVKDDDGEYKEISFDYTTHDLLNFFEYEAKSRGIKVTFKSIEALSARIRNSEDVLKAENWTYKSKLDESGDKPKEKRNNRGNRIYKLTKTFNIESF